MRRIVAAMAMGVGMLAGLGCAGKAEYVQKNKDGGIIALKVGADDTEARKLMEKHLGSNYEIVDKYDPKQRQPGGADPLASLRKPGEKSLFAPKDEAVVHIAYRKLPDSQFGGGTPKGLPPAPKDGGFVPVSSTARQPKPITTGGPSTGFASDPGTMEPPKLFGQ